jgi:hypothetical protein
MKIIAMPNTNNDTILITVILNNLDVVCRWLTTQNWSNVKIEKFKNAMKNADYELAMDWLGKDLNKVVQYIQNISSH